MRTKAIKNGDILEGFELKLSPSEGLIVLQALDRLSQDEEVAEFNSISAARMRSMILEQLKGEKE